MIRPCLTCQKSTDHPTRFCSEACFEQWQTKGPNVDTHIRVEKSELFRSLVKRYSRLGEIENVVATDFERIIAWARSDVTHEHKHWNKVKNQLPATNMNGSCSHRLIVRSDGKCADCGEDLNWWNADTIV